jgi:hypothetical protein
MSRQGSKRRKKGEMSLIRVGCCIIKESKAKNNMSLGTDYSVPRFLFYRSIYSANEAFRKSDETIEHMRGRHRNFLIIFVW